MQLAKVVLAALAAVTLASGAPAQELTDAEVLERFGIQKQVMHDARSGLGASRSIGTRGVTLVTVEDVPAAAPGSVAPASGTPSSEPGVTVAGTGGSTSAPMDPNAPLQVALFNPELQVNLRVTFGFDSAAIDRSELPKLEQICRVMKQATDVEVFRIIGHTDASGSADYNERLSMLRAEEVARYLTLDCGVEASRLETMGLGKRFLYDENEPLGDANRRVEFQVVS